MDSWLIWKLTAGRTHSIDVTNASRTMLLNLETGAWDHEMLSLLGVPPAMLPTVAPSCGVVGMTDPSVLGREIPIAGVAGDQQAALFGQACFRPGMSKNTYGTGCFLLEHTGAERPVSRHKMLATAAAETQGRAFALEGAIFIAGAAINGCGTRWDCSNRPANPPRWPHRFRIRPGSIWSRPSSASARPTGTATPGESSPG